MINPKVAVELASSHAKRAHLSLYEATLGTGIRREVLDQTILELEKALQALRGLKDSMS